MLVAIFVLGLVVGSFLNALIYRLYSGQSMLESHSRCPECNHELGFWDLFPLASFIFLRGKCRYCQQPISWQYPLVEITTAIAFLLIYNFQFSQSSPLGFSGQMIFNFIFAAFLIVIFVYDLKHYLILDKVVFPAIILAIVFQLFFGDITAGVVGGLVLSGFFLILYLVSKGKWIGFGDVKLGLFLGILAGWPVILVTFFAAYLTGAVVAFPLVVFRLKRFADKLPFGTFLTFAAFVAMIWGEALVGWYFDLIGVI